MSKISKILLIIIPVIFILNFFTLTNGQFTQSPSLQKIGDLIGLTSFFSFIILIIYLIFKKNTGGLYPSKNKNELQKQTLTVKKESDRSFNLIWFVLFGFFIVPNLYSATVINSHYLFIPLVFAVVGFIVSLLLIIFRRNNFFILIPLLIISIVVNFISARFYDFTWFLYPNFNAFAALGGITEKWMVAGMWGTSFLTVTASVYVFLSSLSRLFFKKTWAKRCFLTSLFLTGFTSCILFYLLPISFTFPKTEIKENPDLMATLEILDMADPVNGKSVTSVQSATSFFIYATNLSKGKRYGIRILTPELKTYKEESTFLPCRNSNCEFDFGGWNNIQNRFKPGIYTIQIIAQEGKEMTVAAKAKIKITELIIKPYNKNTDYPCKIWLTLGNSNEKLMRIDVIDDQKMIDVGVFVQCQKDQTYNAQIAVGTLGNKTVYYQNTISSAGEQVKVVSLGGNTAHGLVRLIIDNQVMGEAIINRGFPICDGNKIVEGGEDINCQ